MSLTPNRLGMLALFAWLLVTPLGAGINSWTSIGPEGGFIRRIQMDPTDHRILYAETDGGLYKSLDAGQHWTALPAAGYGLVIDPTDHNRLYILKVTDLSEGFRSIILRSFDGGESWSRANLNLSRIASSLAIDPFHSSTLYAVFFGDACERSTDGGDHWNSCGFNLPGGDPRWLAFDPSRPSVIYALRGYGPPQLMRSMDGGRNWEITLEDHEVSKPVFDLLHTDTLYVFAWDRIYKSVNGGDIWNQLNLSIAANGQITDLAINPKVPDELWVTTSDGLYCSTDGGGHWTKLQSTGVTGLGILSQILIDPINPTIFYGTGQETQDRQLFYRSLNKGKSWSPSSSGILATQIHSLVVNPLDSDVIYAAGISGLFRTADQGSHWELMRTHDIFQSIGDVVIDPINPKILYLADRSALNKSLDGGETWTSINFLGRPLDTSEPISFGSLSNAPTDPSVLYAGKAGWHGSTGAWEYPDVFKSTDAGLTWKSTHVGYTSTYTQALPRLAVDPQNADVTWVTASGGEFGFGLYKTTDGGANWVGFLPEGTTLTVAIDPTRPDTVFAGTEASVSSYPGEEVVGEGLVKSSDGGLHWTASIGLRGVNLNCLVVDPVVPSVVYAGGQSGVYRSDDGGLTWSPLMEGMKSSNILALALDPSDHRTLYAVTENLGVWTLTADEITNPQFNMISPGGGERWGAGSVKPIRWTSVGSTSNLTLELSIDGGRHYTPIASGLPNTGEYLWTVPEAPSDYCLVRLRQSDGIFSIITPHHFSIVACPKQIDPRSQNAEAGGGSGSVQVACAAECGWSVSSSVDWISVTSGKSGSGNGSVTYSIAPNTTDGSRSGSLMIGGQVFSVVQASRNGDTSNLFVPVVVSVGGANNSYYTSELALTNRGPHDASVQLSYTDAGATGPKFDNVAIPLSAGRQIIIPDVIRSLRSSSPSFPVVAKGVGTLSVQFTGLFTPRDAAATLRTTTPTVQGRVGLAYTGLTADKVLNGPAHICGLRQNAQDRSNVAFQNAGQPADGAIELVMTVFSEWGEVAGEMPRLTLLPGGFFQVNGVLKAFGLESGRVRVERVSGTAPYYCYGVINDQSNSDGSFIHPQPEESTVALPGLILPVIVETDRYTSELILSNWSTQEKEVDLDFRTDSIQPPYLSANLRVGLQAGEQLMIPSIVDYLRQQSNGLPPVGTTIAGALFASVVGGDCGGLFLAARTTTAGHSGRYGLFYSAVPSGAGSSTDVWLYGLQQNGENRSNLALVNTGETDAAGDTFNIELYDGDTGSRVNTITGIRLASRAWKQINMILAQYAPLVNQGYAHVIRTGGDNPFIAYAVINDGAQPGERTGDGAYLPSLP